MRYRVLASAVLLSACVGQSGSEAIPPRTPQPTPPGIPQMPHCPCDGLREYQQVRATVLEVEAIPPFTDLRRYTLRAEAILSDAQRGEASLRPGDRFGGYWQGELACGSETRAPIAVDAEVLAFYRRGWQDGALCCEYITCSDACPRQQPEGGPPSTSPVEACDQQCMADTTSACAAHREEAVMRGDLMLVPWADELVVGRSEHGEATITTADLPALALDRDACMDALEDRYPALHPQDSSPATPTPSPGPEPQPSEPAPPMTPAEQPPPSAAPPSSGASGNTPGSGAPAPTNPVGPAGGPPAHPEEVRVRCR